MQDLGDALKAAMAEPGPTGYGVGPTSSQLPGAVPGAAPGVAPGAPQGAGVPPMQTPEEVGKLGNSKREKIIRIEKSIENNGE